jgi:hypothetical protein
MQNTDTMVAFYRGLRFQVRETTSVISVYVGDQMINFHRPTLWQNPTFTLKAPAARPPCGDLCFVWDGPPASLKALLDRAGATLVEGPVNRQGGRQKSGSSVYVSGSSRCHDVTRIPTAISRRPEGNSLAPLSS